MSPFTALLLCFVAASSVEAYYPNNYYGYYRGGLNYYNYPYSPFRLIRDDQGTTDQPEKKDLFKSEVFPDSKIFWGRSVEPSTAGSEVFPDSKIFWGRSVEPSTVGSEVFPDSKIFWGRSVEPSTVGSEVFPDSKIFWGRSVEPSTVGGAAAKFFDPYRSPMLYVID